MCSQDLIIGLHFHLIAHPYLEAMVHGVSFVCGLKASDPKRMSAAQRNNLIQQNEWWCNKRSSAMKTANKSFGHTKGKAMKVQMTAAKNPSVILTKGKAMKSKDKPLKCK